MGHLLNVERDINALKNKAALSKMQEYALLKSLSRINLLTPDFANAKTQKNGKFTEYQSYILHLSPADLGLKALNRRGTLCPMASQGCKAACLNTAGRGRFDSIQLSRLRKTLYFILYKDAFMNHLVKEISKLNAKAISQDKKLVIRLNGTSDIQWENIVTNTGTNIFEAFTDVQFYDYTKILKRVKNQPSNYYLIFSASESNESDWINALTLGVNVAMVFNALPTSWQGFEVISGDDHDLRFLDARQGVIVGLKAKGKAKQDVSGFVKQTCNVKVVA